MGLITAKKGTKYGEKDFHVIEKYNFRHALSQKYSVALGDRLCGTYLYKPNASSGVGARREMRQIDRVREKNRQNLGKQRFK